MLPAISSAVSGMRAASLRLEASARNVANVSSRGVPPPSATEPQVYLAVRVHQVTGPQNAVTVASVRNVSPAWMVDYDAGAEFADADGLVAAPNVTLTEEAFEQTAARNSFLANAKTFETAQDMVRRLFEIAD